ncbi:hypothetical protein AGLY_003236 [Aphis glycines]|uniref:Uncharacterized protein n=1 Tax=Aphis glycines TaxID=307491 RepID=A0A6G0U2K2_APHGL|nr:hypothetical protein AGLY_003236 [Aphis glycines]
MNMYGEHFLNIDSLAFFKCLHELFTSLRKHLVKKLSVHLIIITSAKNCYKMFNNTYKFLIIILVVLIEHFIIRSYDCFKKNHVICLNLSNMMFNYLTNLTIFLLLLISILCINSRIMIFILLIPRILDTTPVQVPLIYHYIFFVFSLYYTIHSNIININSSGAVDVAVWVVENESVKIRKKLLKPKPSPSPFESACPATRSTKGVSSPSPSEREPTCRRVGDLVCNSRPVPSVRLFFYFFHCFPHSNGPSRSPTVFIFPSRTTVLTTRVGLCCVERVACH